MSCPKTKRQSKLKLRKVKCDFEVSIHLGFEMLEASEDLVTGGPTYHLLDVIKLAFIYLISLIITHSGLNLSGQLNRRVDKN